MSEGRRDPSPPGGVEPRSSEQGSVEHRAALGAAAKLKLSIERLRERRAFEDEPALFQAWIESHRDDSC